MLYICGRWITREQFDSMSVEQLRNGKKNKSPRRVNKNKKISSLNIRRLKEYKLWRQKILERDNFTCVHCSSKEEPHVDHIVPLSTLCKGLTLQEAKEHGPIWDINNGRVLCRICHEQTESYPEHFKKG